MPLTPEASEAVERLLSGQRQILEAQRQIADKLDILIDALSADDDDAPLPDLDGGTTGGGRLPPGTPL